jgi:hypothetical protein
MTLPAVDTWNLRGETGPPYKVGPLCSSPGCKRFADHAHHIVRRSALGGDFAWVLIDDKLFANLTGLCAAHHDEITGRVGGHRAAIRLEEEDGESIFYWCSLTERNGAVVYLPFAPLEPQPPSPESLAQRASHTHDPDSEHCPFCGQTRRRRTTTSQPTGGRRRRKSWTIKVPADGEDGAEILDTLVDDLAPLIGIDPTASGRYFVVAVALVYAQQNRKDFAEVYRGTGS